MTNSTGLPPTLRGVFALTTESGRDVQSSQWREFQDRLAGELKSVKTASMPDVASKVGELLDIPIPDILIGTWKKTIEIRMILDKSRAAPDETHWAGLGEHTINSEHHPYIDIRIHNQTLKRIEFTIRLLFKLNSFVLKIQRGEIKEIQTGTCEVQGTLEYQGITIAEKRLERFNLPGVLTLDG